jgi:hypothetical protein
MAFGTAPHGLYSVSSGMLCRANVKAGTWDVIDTTAPQGHNEHDFLVYDSKRDRMLYFRKSEPSVWAFDFKTKKWSEETVAGKIPERILGDGAFIPEIDAALMIFGQDKETMYFYKCAEKRWYTAPYTGNPPPHGNKAGRNFSPFYDPELKVVVRVFGDGHRRLAVNIMRVEPKSLNLTPLR